MDRAVACALSVIPLNRRPGPTIEPPIWQPRVRRHRSRRLRRRRKRARIKRATNERIQALIRQLGHPRFTVRRSAASELRQIGAEAFDLLHAATDDSDPEVAASARYLLRQIAVRWVHSDDSAAVRALLRDYGQQRDELRVARLEAGQAAQQRGRRRIVPHRAVRPLAVGFSPGGAGDYSAGRAVQPSGRRSTPRSWATSWAQARVRRARGSANTGASFAIRPPRSPWQQLIDEETKQLEANADDTSTEIVIGLLWNLADVHRQLDRQQDLVDTVDRMMELDPTRRKTWPCSCFPG